MADLDMQSPAVLIPGLMEAFEENEDYGWSPEKSVQILFPAWKFRFKI
jgi:hypothetical protein